VVNVKIKTTINLCDLLINMILFLIAQNKFTDFCKRDEKITAAKIKILIKKAKATKIPHQCYNAEFSDVFL
jgi:hypothetical protein